MKDKLMRLQLVEHPLTMIFGIVIIQAGKIKVRKAYEDAVKHKRSLVFYSIGLLLILSRIPWGNAPLFRGMQ
jgi:membrane protein CcdC involved in cytochrome C biogenesis